MPWCVHLRTVCPAAGSTALHSAKAFFSMGRARRFFGPGRSESFCESEPKMAKVHPKYFPNKIFPSTRPRHSLDSPRHLDSPGFCPYRTWDIYRNSKRVKFYTTGGAGGDGREKSFSSVSSRSLGRRVCSSRGVKDYWETGEFL